LSDKCRTRLDSVSVVQYSSRLSWVTDKLQVKLILLTHCDEKMLTAMFEANDATH
jgi:hypothetical protein